MVGDSEMNSSDLSSPKEEPNLSSSGGLGDYINFSSSTSNVNSPNFNNADEDAPVRFNGNQILGVQYAIQALRHRINSVVQNDEIMAQENAAVKTNGSNGESSSSMMNSDPSDPIIYQVNDEESATSTNVQEFAQEIHPQPKVPNSPSSPSTDAYSRPSSANSLIEENHEHYYSGDGEYSDGDSDDSSVQDLGERVDEEDLIKEDQSSVHIEIEMNMSDLKETDEEFGDDRSPSYHSAVSPIPNDGASSYPNDFDQDLESSNDEIELCILCGARLIDVRPFREADLRLCEDCTRPYELWERGAWRWNLFMKRCNGKTYCHPNKHGEHCGSCNFWQRVDYVRDALDQMQQDDQQFSAPSSDGGLRSANCASEPGSAKTVVSAESHGVAVQISNDGPSNSSAGISTKRKSSHRSVMSFLNERKVSGASLEEERVKSEYYDTGIKMPRVKHVCRSQATAQASRLPRAKFEPKMNRVQDHEITLSALPAREKFKLLDGIPSSDDDDEIPCWPPRKQPKFERLFPPNRNNMIGHEDEHLKKAKGDHKNVKQKKSKRIQRCRRCKGCKAPPCGKCAHCLDMPKFGGPGTLKQACLERQCQLVLASRQGGKGKF